MNLTKKQRDALTALNTSGLVPVDGQLGDNDTAVMVRLGQRGLTRISENGSWCITRKGREALKETHGN